VGRIALDPERCIRASDGHRWVVLELAHRADAIDVLRDDDRFHVDGHEEAEHVAVHCDRVLPHSYLPVVVSGAANVSRA
jgi:hypothetical protein